MFVVRLNFEWALYDVLRKADICHTQDFCIGLLKERLLTNSTHSSAQDELSGG